jgi:hypothetical protein
MSVFNTAATPTTDTQAEATSSFLEKLVAQKGEQFRDPEALAKKAIHGDEYIAKLEAEKATLAQEAAEAKVYKELIEGLKKDPKAGLAQLSKQEEPEPKPTDAVATPQGQGDIESQFEQLLNKHEQKRKAAGNAQLVEEQLVNSFGDKAPDVIRAKAQELGMSVGKLQEIATDSPKAFFSLIGVAPASQPSRVAVPSSFNTDGFSSKPTGAEAFEKELEKNPKLAYDSNFTMRWLQAMASER